MAAIIFVLIVLFLMLEEECVQEQKESVLNQAQRLVDNGYVEIVLTGIHTAGYGEDLDDYSFYELLVDLVKIKGLKRLRISSIETSQISDEIIDLIGLQ